MPISQSPFGEAMTRTSHSPDLLDYLRHRVTKADPALAVVREATLTVAREGLPGWRP